MLSWVAEEIFGGKFKEQKSPSVGWIIDIEVTNDDKSSVEGEMVLKSSMREGNLSMRRDNMWMARWYQL